MDVEWMMLANHAETANGLLYVNGGAWDTINVPEPLLAASPEGVVAIIQGVLVVRLGLHPTECGRDHPFSLSIMDEDGAEIGKIEGQFQSEPDESQPPGWLQGTHLLMQLTGLALPRFGLYNVHLLINGEHRAQRPFRVIRA